MLSMISPLNESRKRNRIQEDVRENANLAEMELDSEDKRRPISELNVDELRIAQVIAQEGIKASLFISVEIPSQQCQDSTSDASMDFTLPSHSNPFENDTQITKLKRISTFGSNLETPTKHIDFRFSQRLSPVKKTPISSDFTDLNYIPLICKLILKHENHSPSKISPSMEMTGRSIEILESLKLGVTESSLISEDAMNYFRILVYLLRNENLFPPQIDHVCQGILAINQATGLSRRSGGTSIKGPNTMVKGLIRNVLILLPPQSRKILNILIEFTCEFCQKVSARTRNVWAKQLATCFGNTLDKSYLTNTPSKKMVESSWKCVFFELLIHAHGLHSEGYSAGDLKDIWTLDEALVLEVSRRYQAMKTPSRRASMTPTRRNINRNGIIRTMAGSSIRRNLFRPPKKSDPMVNFIHISAEVGTKSPVQAEQASLDRDIYSKRLRIK